MSATATDRASPTISTSLSIRANATRASHIPQYAYSATKEGWNKGADAKCKAHPISDAEVEAIETFYRAAGMTDQEIVCKTRGSYAVYFSNLVWRVLHNQIREYEIPSVPPAGCIANENVPGVIFTFNPKSFNLQPGDTAVWGHPNVFLRQAITTTSYTGGYGGPSIRVANGLWYHFGQMQTLRQQSTSLQEVDVGEILITTHALYFSGRATGGPGINFRLPYRQIMRFKPYEDAVGICRSGLREQILAPDPKVWPDGVMFPRDSGWFLFNILQALAARHSG